MAVSTISLYASPPSSVCSAPHQISPHASYDFDFGSRSSSPASTATASTSARPMIGGLSCLFSSSVAVKHVPLTSFSGGDEDELKELGSSFSYSYSPSKFGGSWKRDRDHQIQSPVSVFQCPVSCSSSMGTVRGASRSSAGGLFEGFVRSALGSSCLDYDSTGVRLRGGGGEIDGGGSSGVVDELTFNLEDTFVEGCSGFEFEPYAKKLLMSAQLRHKIFCEEFVIKAFCEAEKAHRGQVC